MTNNDDMEWLNGKPLPEAPVSITIKGYYKGYSVLITRRKEEMSEDEITNIVKAIDNLEAKGFRPSWNEVTNGTVKTPVKVDPNAPICEVHQKPMTMHPAGVSKATGKSYPAFWSCQEKNADGSFCKFRPATNKI